MRTLTKHGLVATAVLAMVAACGADEQNRQARDPSASESSMQTASRPAQTTTYGSTIDGPGMGPGGMSQGGMGSGPGAEVGGATTWETSGTPRGDQKGKVQRALGDGEIVAVENAVNDGEIEMAELARRNATTMDVKNFVAMMITQHRDAWNQSRTIATKAKIAATESDLSAQRKADVATMINELRNQAQKGQAFDVAYIDDQVTSQRSVLGLFDKQLLPNVSNAELRTHLFDVRSKVADHLAKAEEIQSRFSAKPVGATAPAPDTQKGKGTRSPEPVKPMKDPTDMPERGPGSRY